MYWTTSFFHYNIVRSSLVPISVKSILTSLILVTLFTAQAQEESIANLFRVDYDTPLTIELENRNLDDLEMIEPIPIKKKKKKNTKVFWGVKTKRGFTRNGFGKNVVVELFHYLKPKDFIGPDEYDQDFYYFDRKKKKIVNSKRIKDQSKIGVMHGHYVKKIGDQVLEEGYFFNGQKHRRWVKINSTDILIEKQVYWKGLPEQSLLSFYDSNREKLREAIPVHFGERNGTYYAYHSNGKLAATGKYKWDRRIGLWREYYENQRPKREVVYPDDPFSKTAKPFISKEWDDLGKLIFDKSKS